jgi:DNA (cytosine-5)-methyltransferase 1
VKPEYLVPSMKEIVKVRPNGLTVATTFAGCGGSSLGYRMAGYRIAWANEFVPIAQESYRANMAKKTVLDGRDIRKVKVADILKATGLKKGQLSIFDGSPPCQAFSTAGRREKGWGKDRVYEHGARQRNEDLFVEYIRLLKGLEPKAFIAENVSGLVKGTAKGYFLEILQALKLGGAYRVEARVLDAQWLGVPQARQRVIFIGVRSDIGRPPVFPKPFSYRYTLREALPWIRRGVLDSKGTYRVSDFSAQPVPTITCSNAHHLVVEADADISRYKVGQLWEGLRPGEQHEKHFNLVRAHPDKPSPTICAANGSTSLFGLTHPFEKRKFSIAELKRICSFPDDFVLAGSYKQQWERLGNSVPPIMMKAVAETVRDAILLRRGP